MLDKIMNKYLLMSIEMKATVWFVMCNCIQKGVTVLTIPIFTYIMSVEQYGIFSAYHTWANLLSVLITMNLSSGAYNNAMLKYSNKQDAYTSSMQALICTLTIFWFVMYVIFRNMVETFLDMPFVLVVCMFLETVLNSAFSFWSAQERYNFRYKALVAVSIFYAIASIIIPALYVFYLADEENSATYRAIANVITMIISYGWIWVVINKRGKVLYSKEFWRFGLQFNIPLLPHYLAMTVLGQIDRIMIKNMVGNREAGIYTVAYTIAICLQILTTALNQGFAPWLYRKLNEDNRKEIPSKINSQLFFMFLCTLFFSLLAPEIIKILSTDDYLEAMYIIPPVAGSTFFIFVFQLLANIEFYFFQNKFISIASFSAALINLILNWFFIKKFGYIAAGYTTLISYAILAGMHTMFATNILKKRYGNAKDLVNIKFLSIISLLLIVTCSTLFLLYNDKTIRYGLLIALLFALYLKREKIIAMLQ